MLRVDVRHTAALSQPNTRELSFTHTFPAPLIAVATKHVTLAHAAATRPAMDVTVGALPAVADFSVGTAWSAAVDDVPGDAFAIAAAFG
jgi:hypothetical protein